MRQCDVCKARYAPYAGALSDLICPDCEAIRQANIAAALAKREADKWASVIRSICEKCGRLRRIKADGVCGTCLHREARRVNAREMYGHGRRGY